MSKISLAQQLHKYYDEQGKDAIDLIIEKISQLEHNKLSTLSKELKDYSENFSYFNNTEKSIFTILRKKNDFIQHIPKIINEIENTIKEQKIPDNTLQKNKKRKFKP